MISPICVQTHSQVCFELNHADRQTWPTVYGHSYMRPTTKPSRSRFESCGQTLYGHLFVRTDRQTAGMSSHSYVCGRAFGHDYMKQSVSHTAVIFKINNLCRIPLQFLRLRCFFVTGTRIESWWICICVHYFLLCCPIFAFELWVDCVIVCFII
jgi:hypothetical protein